MKTLVLLPVKKIPYSMEGQGEHEFLVNSQLKAAANHVRDRVSVVVGKDEFQLKDKRNRLDNYLSGESATLQQELELLKTSQIESSINDRKMKSFSVHVEKEAQRKRLAQMKLELYTRENNEELKMKEAYEKCCEASDFNKHKIEQNNKQRLVEKEVESIMDDLLLQQEMEKVEAEERCLHKKAGERIYDYVVLKNQIAEKALRVKEEEEHVVEELARVWQLAKEYEDDEGQEIMKKEELRQSLAKEKYEDLVNSLEVKKKKMIFERELEDYYARTQAPLTDEDPLAKNMKGQLKLEQDLFMETQRHLKEQLRMFEIQEDDLRKQELKKKEEMEAKTRLEDHIRRNKELQNLLRTQIFQVIEKQGK